ncbi:MAG: hypothetical protein GX209_08485 [Epulopiscium sp.]|nr:hypothetical protein [Candidatus Epulonipiscium sp.]
MLAKFLEGTRNCCTPDGGTIQLEYFLLEKENKETNHLTKTYGIEIVKKCAHFGETIYTETDQIESLTHEKEMAKEIINKLIAHAVTPISMLYIIDDLMDETPWR